MHYYGDKGDENGKFNDYKLFSELKKLSITLRNAIKEFTENTGEIPKVITYTNSGPYPLHQTSYVFGELQSEVYNLIFNLDKHEVSLNLDKLELALDGALTRILRKAIINYLLDTKDLLIKNHKKLNSLKGSPNKIREHLFKVNKSDYIKTLDKKQLKGALDSFLKEFSDVINCAERNIAKIKKAHPLEIFIVANYEIQFTQDELDKSIKREAKNILESLLSSND